MAIDDPHVTISPFTVTQKATKENFVEDGYLAANPDVRDAIADGRLESGHEHFMAFGQAEDRRLRNTSAITMSRMAKYEKLLPILRDDMAHEMMGTTFNFLTNELKSLGNIVETASVSALPYGAEIKNLISRFSDGTVLDCGAGQRDVYYPNVINFEIVNYDTTDVLGIGEALPFKDNSFDAVISVAVLEHVRDPFKCAQEIIRVLKPGGKLYCAVPLLQPLHGYPHHYYNMTHQGLANLFDQGVEIDSQSVSAGPIWSLTWIINRWLAQLPPEAAETMRELKIGDIDRNPLDFLEEPFVTQLTVQGQFELASATALEGTKRGL